MSCTAKQCQNDWIYLNASCYEDTCCTSFETAISWYYRSAQTSHIVFSIFGFLFVVLYTSRFASKHMLPTNIRALVYIMLFFIVVHSADMIVLHIYHIFDSFHALASNPCSVRKTVSFCGPFRYIYSFCTLSFATCQYCIYIDRVICAFYQNYIKNQKIILVVLILQMMLIPSLLCKWVYRNEQGDTYLLSCLNVPTASLSDMTLITAVFLPINLICFGLSIILFRHFKRKQSRSRFNINSHFTAAVDLESSEFLYRTTGTQAAIMALFSMVSLLMRLTYSSFPRSVGLTIATLSYIFSIYCFTVPLVMIRYAQKTTRGRKVKILKQVNLKSVGREGANNYFGMMKSQWG